MTRYTDLDFVILLRHNYSTQCIGLRPAQRRFKRITAEFDMHFGWLIQMAMPYMTAPHLYDCCLID